ncbi:MAG: flippase-like domain-containing protein [Pyrinomonadaceae bacterium]|nr:flippase-like domain-containing protein [Pyrinomonadaceae bacterium]
MRKHLKFIVLILLAALILWWFGRGLDWKEVTGAVRSADWRLLLAAVAVICVGYLIRAYRWRTLLAPLTPARLREVFVATTMGFAAIFVFGRAGEVVRPVVLPLRERRVRPAASFVTIAVERICDMTLIAVLFALNLLWFPVPANRVAEFATIRRSGVILLAAIALGLLGLAWFRRRSKGAIGWLDKRFKRLSFIPQRVSQTVIHLLEQLARALSIFVDARELMVTAAWTCSLWIAVGIATWLILHAFGLGFGPKESLFVMCWGLVGSMVPTPGGSAGAFHATTQYGLHTFLSVDPNKSAAIAIIMHLVFFGPALIFGLYYFLRGEVSLKRVRELARPEAVEHAVEDEDLDINSLESEKKIYSTL